MTMPRLSFSIGWIFRMGKFLLWLKLNNNEQEHQRYSSTLFQFQTMHTAYMQSKTLCAPVLCIFTWIFNQLILLWTKVHSRGLKKKKIKRNIFPSLFLLCIHWICQLLIRPIHLILDLVLKIIHFYVLPCSLFVRYNRLELSMRFSFDGIKIK